MGGSISTMRLLALGIALLLTITLASGWRDRGHHGLLTCRNCCKPTCTDGVQPLCADGTAPTGLGLGSRLTGGRFVRSPRDSSEEDSSEEDSSEGDSNNNNRPKGPIRPTWSTRPRGPT